MRRHRVIGLRPAMLEIECISPIEYTPPPPLLPVRKFLPHIHFPWVSCRICAKYQDSVFTKNCLVKLISFSCVSVLHRSPFFSMGLTQDVQGFLEGLDQINGAVVLSLNECAMKRRLFFFCCGGIRPDVDFPLNTYLHPRRHETIYSSCPSLCFFYWRVGLLLIILPFHLPLAVHQPAYAPNSSWP